MQQRVWFIRILSILLFSLISLLIAITLDDSFIINYINTSFFIGLLFLTISGSAYVIISGFFRVFAEGFNIIFKKGDDTVDRTHWSYDKADSNERNQINLLRNRAKKELFIFLPLLIGLSLIAQSIIILYLF